MATKKSKKLLADWMLFNGTVDQDRTDAVVLAVILHSKERKKFHNSKHLRYKAYLIRVLIAEKGYDIEGISGYSDSINPCSRTKTLYANSEFDAIKCAAHLLHRKIHKMKDIYVVKDLFARDELAHDRFLEVSSCEPCQVPFKKDPKMDHDGDLVDRLSTLELS